MYPLAINSITEQEPAALIYIYYQLSPFVVFYQNKPDPPKTPVYGPLQQLNSHTNFIYHCNHFLQFIRTDVRAVSEAKVDQHPLANVVLAGPGLSLMADEREGPSQQWLPNASVSFLLQFYKTQVGIKHAHDTMHSAFQASPGSSDSCQDPPAPVTQKPNVHMPSTKCSFWTKSNISLKPFET